MIRRIISFLLLFCVFFAYSQVNTETMIFDKSFKSLKTAVVGNDYAPPVVLLNGRDRVNVSFDQLNTEAEYLRYSVVHCDADWKPSQLVESEYVDGFNEANVSNYAYSSATLANYVHYSIQLPNEDLKLKLSGNYLLKVYPENNPDSICLQTRFSLYEDYVSIIPSVTSRTDIDYNDKHQQVSIEVDCRDYEVDNLYTDLKIRVLQNMRYDNSAFVTHPQRVAGNRAFFEHNRSLIFKAGNEFRRFEMVTTNYYGMGIYNYTYNPPYYHAILKIDEPRVYEPYTYDRTQYGRFTIRQSDVFDSNTDADYMVVHFSLEMPYVDDGNVYVSGEFTQNNCDLSNIMHYNHNEQRYEADIFLKMGAYNYQYLWMPKGSNIPQTGLIEGDFYQTVNEYTCLVYNKRRTERYDRLVGFKTIFSGN